MTYFSEDRLKRGRDLQNSNREVVHTISVGKAHFVDMPLG